MPYVVHIFPRAMADLRAAVLWRKQQSPSAASRWLSRLIMAVHSLANNPERCPLADEADDLGLSLRELLYGRKHNVYRILFVIEGLAVNVLRVRHAAQDRLTPADI